jgi:serine/threonine protein kinase
MNAPGPLPFPADGHAPAGHRLGHFELRGVAARNAHAIVYRAWDHELGIAVAIKEYLPQQLARRDARGDLQPQGSVAIGAFERGRDAFINEVRLLARCDHPSLVRVRQLLRMHGTVYRVMPWCQGWPLADLRREMADPPDEPALRRLLDEVLGALEVWHRVAGPHGGVNPAKILLLDDDRALLLGPGLARRAAADADDDAQSPPPPFGRSFLAPEQWAPSVQTPCGPWTDFFALAQVVRYCITGMLPQPDAPATEPLEATVESLYFDAPHVRYDADFLRALDAAAAPAIGERPRSAAEFRDWLEQGPPRAAPVPAAAAGEATAAQVGAASGAEVDIPVEPDPPAAPDAAASALAEANAGGAKEEAVDEATVDLIRRVVESIPEQNEPPPQPAEQSAEQAAAQGADRAAEQVAAQSAFAEPILRADDWANEPSASPPPRRKKTGIGWLLAVVLLGAAGCAAWAWGWPAWQGLERAATSTGSATTTLRPSAPTPESISAPTVPAAAVAVAPDAPAPAAPVASAAAAPQATAEPETPASSPTSQASAPSDSAVATIVVSQTPPTAAAAAAAPEAVEPTAPTARRTSPDSPRLACGSRTQFALYRCMQQQCEMASWARHEQCVQFKAADRVE